MTFNNESKLCRLLSLHNKYSLLFATHLTQKEVKKVTSTCGDGVIDPYEECDCGNVKVNRERYVCAIEMAIVVIVISILNASDKYHIVSLCKYCVMFRCITTHPLSCR